MNIHMRENRVVATFLVALIFLVTANITLGAVMTGGNYSLEKDIISSGDSSPSGGNYTVDQTIGEISVLTMTGGSYELLGSYVDNTIFPASPSISSPTDQATAVSTTPAIQLSTTDTGGDYLQYKIQLATDTEFTQNLQTFDQTSSQTGWSGQNATITTTDDAYTSGTTATYTVQSALDNNTVYYIRAYAIDPGDSNAWTSASSSILFLTAAAPIEHDTEAEFDTAEALNRLESVSGPTVQGVYSELPADEYTVALYHMNNDWTDSSGNGNNGSAQGDATFTTSGKLGSHGGTFDGTGDYIDLGTDSSLDFGTGDFTVEAWVKSSGSALFDIVQKDNSLTLNDAGYALYMRSSDPYLRFKVDSGSAQTYTAAYGGSSLFDDEWHHVAGVRNGDMIYTYVDGELKNTASGASAYNVSNAINLEIGRDYNNGTPGSYFNGEIDEVRISNIARTPEEIKAAAQYRPYAVYTSDVLDLGAVGSWNSFSWTESGVQTGDGETLADATNLVAHWKFNETTNTSTADNAEGTAARDGTLTNFGTCDDSQDNCANSGWTATNKKWGAGALMLDGSNDYVDCGTDSAFNFGSGNFTYEVWVKTSVSSGIIISQDNNSTNNRLLHFDPGPRLMCRDSGGDYISAKSPTTINDNKWHHVVAVRNGTTGYMYVDGELKASHTNAAVGSCDGGTNTQIGRRNYAPSPFYFKGTIDSVRAYSRALGAAEILANYNATNIEFQTRSSANNSTWEAWRPTTSESTLANMDSDASNWSWDSTATKMPQSKADESNIKVQGTGSIKLTTGAPQVDANTVALWHLDETNGDNAGDDVFDETTNNNDGEFNGSNVATAVVDGISGKARNFNGNNDYINVGDHAQYSASNYSASLWVKLDQAGHSNNDDYIFNKPTERTLLYDGDGTSGFACTSDKFCFAQYDGDWQYAISTTSPAPGQWYHIVTTYDGTNMRIYVNGVLEDTQAQGAVSDIASDLAIGGSPTTSGYSANASIDEVRISNVVRTAEEIAEAYRAGRDHYLNKTITSADLSSETKLPFYVAADRPGTYLEATVGEGAYANYQPDANTVGLWHLDEGTNNAVNAGNDDVADASGNSDHGDLTSTPDIVQGKIGKARSFDGSSDEGINLGDVRPFTNAFTIDAWVKPNTISSTHAIVSKRYGGSNSFVLRFSSSNINFGLNNGSERSCTTSGVTTSTGNWHHIAAVYDTSLSKQLIYLDGQFVYECTSIGNSDLLYDTNNTTIGIYSNLVSYDFDGIIDEVRLSDKVRSAEEIRAAYEVGRRTHPITIDFAASLSSDDLITGSGDTGFEVDATSYGAENQGDNLYVYDKVIVRETVDDTEYIAQGDVTAVTASSGAVTIDAWDSGSTFPSGGYTANASVFKWQREWFEIASAPTEPRNDWLDAVTQITLRVTNGNEGRTIYLDDFKAGGAYMSTSGGSTITSTAQRYLQYQAVLSTTDTDVFPSFSAVTVDYDSELGSSPTAAGYAVVKEAAGGGGPLTIQWSDNSTDESGFEIQKSTNSGAWATLVTKAADATSHEDSSVSNGNTYQYRVRATKAAAASSTWYHTAVVDLSTGDFKLDNIKLDAGTKLD